MFLCLTLCFVACGNNVDASDDGVIDDGTTTNMPDDGTTTDDGITDSNQENNTTENSDDNQGGNNEEQPNDSTNDNATSETVRITSDTGSKINLVVEYTVKSKTGNTREIDVVVYLESYSVNVTARGNTNYVRIGDETFYFSTDAISYDGTAKKLTKFAEHTFTVTTSNDTLPIYALWNFNGVYSEKPISAIIIENTINLK